MIEIIIISISVFLIGSLLHFTHSFLPKWKFVDIFSATNESTWEHVKILIVGAIISTFGYWVIVNGNLSILITSLIGIWFSSIFMIFIFYLYKTILGKNYLWFDIFLFFVCSFVFTYIMSMYREFELSSLTILCLVIIGWLSLFILIYWFTFFPPKNFLFKCPVSKRYGHKHCK